MANTRYIATSPTRLASEDVAAPEEAVEASFSFSDNHQHYRHLLYVQYPTFSFLTVLYLFPHNAVAAWSFRLNYLYQD